MKQALTTLAKWPRPPGLRAAAAGLAVTALLLGMWWGLRQFSGLRLNDPQNSQPLNQERVARLAPGQVFEQTLRVRRAPLSELTVWAASAGEALDGSQGLSLGLYRLDGGLVYSAAISTAGLGQTGQSFTIGLPPEAGAAGDYRLELRSRGRPLWLYGRGHEVYAAGAGRLDGQALAGDLAFLLNYRYELAALGADVAGKTRCI